MSEVMMEKKPVVLLVAFYNIKALGVRYLETALRRSGYDVATVFFKDFNSLHPKPTNETELKLLNDAPIEHEQPIPNRFLRYELNVSSIRSTAF